MSCVYADRLELSSPFHRRIVPWWLANQGERRPRHPSASVSRPAWCNPGRRSNASVTVTKAPEVHHGGGVTRDTRFWKQDRQTDTELELALHDVGDRLSAADGERDRTPCSSACVGLAARTQRAQREDRQTDRRTDRQEAERAILTVIEVFIWIEGDLDT